MTVGSMSDGPAKGEAAVRVLNIILAHFAGVLTNQAG